MKSGGILTIGSANMDLVAHVSRLPRPGETITGDRFFMAPGGKGANQAVAVSRLGGESRFVGRVGCDLFGDRLIEGLREAGVDTSLVVEMEEVATGVALIHVEAGGENAITAIPGANADLLPADIERVADAIADAEVLLLQLEIPLATVVEVIRIARRNRTFVILDPAPVPAESLPEELLHVDLLTPNQAEATQLTGVTVTDAGSAEQTIRRLKERGAGQLVLKAGDHGLWLDAEDGSIAHTSAFEVEVVDTTAAGDATTAALAVGKVEGMARREAARLACAAGALACTRDGAQSAMPPRVEVDRLI